MPRRGIRIRRVGRVAESNARIGRHRSQLHASEIHRPTAADAHRRPTRIHSGRHLPQQRRRLGPIHRVRHLSSTRNNSILKSTVPDTTERAWPSTNSSLIGSKFTPTSSPSEVVVVVDRKISAGSRLTFIDSKNCIQIKF